MKELINNELSQLQKDLENLQSASNMISQAGKASSSVIEEAKSIHEDFAKNLDKLTTLYTEFLEAANKQSTQNQLLVVDHVKQSISEQAAIFDKYSTLVDTANSNTQALYEKAVASQKEAIEKLSADTQQKIEEQRKLVAFSAEDAAQKVDTVKKTYLKQSEQTDKLLNSYLELAQSTAELKDKITSIDFPSRLDTMSKLIAEYNERQKSDSENITKILEVVSSPKILRSSRENGNAIKSVKNLAVVTLLVLLAAIGAIAYYVVKHPF